MIALWHGRLPLARAFWEYAILYGLAASLVATVAALALFQSELPPIIGVIVHLLPTPYFVLATVGVWRSAAAYQGPRQWAQAARLAAILWAGLMVIV